jgi:hypothetical protein
VYTHLIAVNELPTLCAPDVNTLVKTPTGQKLPIRREGHAVHRLLVPGGVVVRSYGGHGSDAYLVRVCTQVPLSTSHNLTVESKLAEAKTWEWITC